MTPSCRPVSQVTPVPDNVRVRIAPSPTGHLHVGTARTALYNYLYARRHNGTFVFRLEDTDEERSKEEYTQDIIDGLKWLGIQWDEGPDIGGPFAPYKQTQKIDHYDSVANQLIAKGKAYLCYATPEELEALREDQRQNKLPSRYDNRGRDLTPEQCEHYQKEGRIPSIRFRVEEPQVVSWNDRIKGEISIDTSDIGGDFVIVKSNGVATYNFAVVVDDIDMKMSHVLRGEDHIHNTAKQILLYEALDHKLPTFGHAPLMFDLDRRKLSKRLHGESVHVRKYQLDGYMPEAIVNYLAQMSWTPADGKEIFTLAEASTQFDLDKVSKSPAVFDTNRLNWYNSHYIRSLPLSIVTDRAIPFLSEFDLSIYSRGELEEVVAAVRERVTFLKEIAPLARFFFGNLVEIPDQLRNDVLSPESARKVIDKCLESLKSMPWGDHAGCKKIVDAFGKELGLKGKELYWPLRAALSGKTEGPDLGAMISILGEKRVRARLESSSTLPCSKS